MIEKTAENTLAARLEQILHPGGILDKVAEDTLLVDETEDTTAEVEETEKSPEETAELVTDEVEEEVSEETTEKVATDPEVSAIVEIMGHPEFKRGFHEVLESRLPELEEAIEKKATEFLEFYSQDS